MDHENQKELLHTTFHRTLFLNSNNQPYNYVLNYLLFLVPYNEECHKKCMFCLLITSLHIQNQ